MIRSFVLLLQTWRFGHTEIVNAYKLTEIAPHKIDTEMRIG